MPFSSAAALTPRAAGLIQYNALWKPLRLGGSSRGVARPGGVGLAPRSVIVHLDDGAALIRRITRYSFVANRAVESALGAMAELEILHASGHGKVLV